MDIRVIEDFTKASHEERITFGEVVGRLIQAGRTKYLTFCRQIMEAGCVGYLVSMQGRCAVYYGRSGETYVEPFPSATS